MQSNLKVGEFYKTAGGDKLLWVGVDLDRDYVGIFYNLDGIAEVCYRSGEFDFEIIGPWEEPEAETPAQKDAREGQELLKMGGGKATEKSTTPSVTPDAQRFWDQVFCAALQGVLSSSNFNHSCEPKEWSAERAMAFADAALAKRRERFGG